MSLNDLCYTVLYEIVGGGHHLNSEDMLTLRKCCKDLRKFFTMKVIAKQMTKELMSGVDSVLQLDRMPLLGKYFHEGYQHKISVSRTGVLSRDGFSNGKHSNSRIAAEMFHEIIITVTFGSVT